MREKTCVNCGETVVVADAGETVTSGETPREHLDRTGHAHIHEPEPRTCEDCGYLWMYGGDADLPTCPNCRGKRTQPGKEIQNDG